MDWGDLAFLSERWFVAPWYAVGIAGAFVVARDMHTKNTPLKQAMKWAWPIIVLFFSVVGLALYYGTARAPRIGRIGDPDAKKKAHQQFEKNMFRRVNGAVIHCVAGDGVGIMSGMVIARAFGMSFWQEFWFEYLVGFLAGWFVFQYKSMAMMADSAGKALAMAFRAEFFSMLTVMAGMGAVMTYVTPLAVTAQPKPLTFAFWGFGMLGLMVGYAITFPMNWMLVKVGWKHGMGGMEGSHQAEGRGAKAALVAGMVALGIAALALPAWLTERRNSMPVRPAAPLARAAGIGGGPPASLAILRDGLRSTLAAALADLQAHRRSEAAHAIDASLHAAEVGKVAAPLSGFERVLDDVKGARYALHMGDEPLARQKLAAADGALRDLGVQVERPPPSEPGRYLGATAVNARGEEIGEVTGAGPNEVRLSLGGGRDVWGFWDLSTRQVVRVPAAALVFGPTPSLGLSLVALPTLERPPLGASGPAE